MVEVFHVQLSDYFFDLSCLSVSDEFWKLLMHVSTVGCQLFVNVVPSEDTKEGHTQLDHSLYGRITKLPRWKLPRAGPNDTSCWLKPARSDALATCTGLMRDLVTN